MQVVIDASICGTEKHLLIDNDSIIDWVDNIPDGIYHYDGTFKRGHCFDTLLMLYNKELQFDNVVLPKINSLLKTLNVDIKKIHYSSLLTKEQLVENLKHVILQISSRTSSNIDTSYHLSTWQSTSKIFERLQPSLINQSLYDEFYSKETSGNKSCIRTFKSRSNGYTKEIKYNRFGTRTGRLTVANGPNILLLKKDYRKMLKSRFSTGNICYYDFSALEVRVALYESNKRCDLPDIYEWLVKEVFDNKVDRSHVKKTIISLMYGRQNSSIAQELKLSIDEVNKISERLISYFCLYDTWKHVKDEFIKFGFVNNRYGRQVVIEEVQDNIIFNSYIQSTGVDVTLLGFEEVCKNYLNSPNNETIPLFVLHDALFFDVKYMKLLPNVIWIKIPGYVQKFPLKLEKIS